MHKEILYYYLASHIIHITSYLTSFLQSFTKRTNHVIKLLIPRYEYISPIELKGYRISVRTSLGLEPEAAVHQGMPLYRLQLSVRAQPTKGPRPGDAFRVPTLVCLIQVGRNQYFIFRKA